MNEDYLFVPRIQKFYEIISSKIISIEDKAMTVVTDDRTKYVDQVEILKNISREYEHIFKDYIYMEN